MSKRRTRLLHPVLGEQFALGTVTCEDLAADSWEPPIGGSASDDGDQRTVTDPAASETRKFHTVEIEKP